MKNIFLTFLILISLGSLKVAYAQDVPLNYSGLVQCDGVTTASEKERQNTCNFAYLVGEVNYIIKWVFGLTIPIFVFIIAYAGILYMGPPSSGRRSKAKKMLWAAVTGFVIMLSAYLIVTTILGWVID